MGLELSPGHIRKEGKLYPGDVMRTQAALVCSDLVTEHPVLSSAVFLCVIIDLGQLHLLWQGFIVVDLSIFGRPAAFPRVLHASGTGKRQARCPRLGRGAATMRQLWGRGPAQTSTQCPVGQIDRQPFLWHRAPAIAGVNTLLLSASHVPVPHVIAIAATPSGDGILQSAGRHENRRLRGCDGKCWGDRPR